MIGGSFGSAVHLSKICVFPILIHDHTLRHDFITLKRPRPSCNKNIEKFIVYDWALELKSIDVISEFLNDPIKFLEGIEAFSSMPNFNDFINSSGEKIEPHELRAHYEKHGNGEKFSMFHMGIPYREPWYCRILV